MTASSISTGDWPIGTPAAKALGLDDPMIYVKVTPNRPDALGVHGIARDLAAKGLGKLKPLECEARCRHVRFAHQGVAGFSTAIPSPARFSSGAISRA